GGDEDDVRSVGGDLFAQLAVERTGHEVVAGTVEKALAVGEKARPTMTDVVPCERGDALGSAAGGGDAIELARDRRREDDHAVAIPRAAPPGRRIAERHPRSP